MKKFFYNLKLQTKLIILICCVFILAVIAENIYIIKVVNNENYKNISQQVENVADIISDSPEIIYHLATPTEKNIAAIQSYTETARQLGQVDFIVVMDMKGIRQSHPNSDKIGQMIVGGDGLEVLQGKSYLSTAKGTLGFSLRAFRPIFSDNQQIGAVMVGTTYNTIDHLASRTNQPILLTLFISLLIAILLAVLLSRNIKKILLGLEPAEIVKLLEERDAILRTVREGIIVINRSGHLTLVNDEAKRILHIPEEKNRFTQRHVSDFIPNTRLYDVMLTGTPEYDCEQNINGAVILTNRTPLIVNNELVGAVASFRDMTEIRHLAENLTGVNRYADALRSQAHEFYNKLHVIYGLVFNENRTELLAYLSKIMGNQSAESKPITKVIKDPIIAGFLNSKFSRAREFGIVLNFTTHGSLQHIPDSSVTHSIVTILGNLIDNGLESIEAQEDKKITVDLTITSSEFEITVKDNGAGVPPNLLSKIFSKGYSTKGSNRGFGLYLVLASIDELNGTIEIDTTVNQGACFCVSLPLETLYREKP